MGDRLKFSGNLLGSADSVVGAMLKNKILLCSRNDRTAVMIVDGPESRYKSGLLLDESARRKFVTAFVGTPA
ncbi:hypothetical protein [Dactylosporangium roseum]|uniref:hypothetical protein n=1 Tax=Dactylosporangium roseum TaxID=47989 RepID=UPI0021B3F1B7|nr:hypothetical protein [Dactylosporangium roseum]